LTLRFLQRDGRYYAIVVAAEGRDLNDLLVSAGAGANLRNANTAAGWSRFADIFGALGRVGSAGEARTTRSMGKGDAVKYWEIIADNLSKAGWGWGCMSTVSSNGMRLAIKIVTSGRDQNTDLMNFIFTKNIGMLLLAII
jgi:hypothetical protein